MFCRPWSVSAGSQGSDPRTVTSDAPCPACSEIIIQRYRGEQARQAVRLVLVLDVFVPGCREQVSAQFQLDLVGIEPAQEAFRWLDDGHHADGVAGKGIHAVID